MIGFRFHILVCGFNTQLVCNAKMLVGDMLVVDMFGSMFGCCTNNHLLSTEFHIKMYYLLCYVILMFEVPHVYLRFCYAIFDYFMTYTYCIGLLILSLLLSGYFALSG